MFKRIGARVMCVLLLAVGIVGCGNENSAENTSVVSTQSPVTVNGQAARGSAISGATVTIRDTKGRVVFSTTDAAGLFSGNFQGDQIAPPFIIEVKGGTYTPKGGGPIANDLVLHSVSVDGSRVNVTTLTELVFAALFQSLNTAVTFNGFATNANAIARLTQQNVTAMVLNVITALSSKTVNGQPVAGLTVAVDTSAFADFMRAAFTANGQGPDSVLDALAAAGNFTTINNALGAANFPLPSSNTTTTNTTGNTTGTTLYSIAGGSVVNFTFVPGQGYNGKNPPVSGGLLTGAAATNSSSGFASLAFSGLNGTLDSLLVGVNVPTGNLTVGKTYPIVVNNTTEGSIAALTYTNVTTQTANPVWTIGGNSTGNVTIVTLNNSTLELKFDVTNVVPNPQVTNNTAAGSFSFSGQWKGTVVSATSK